MTLVELENEEKSLSKLLSDNRAKQLALNKIAFVEKHGVDVGDKIQWRDGRSIKRGVVSGLVTPGTRVQGYLAFLINSDGNVGKRECRLWSFQLGSMELISKATT